MIEARVSNPPGKHAARNPPAPRLAFWLLIAIIVIALDQLTKLYFNHLFQYGERLQVLPIFDLTLIYNRGAAFSLLASQPGWQRWFFIALGLGTALLIVGLLRRSLKQPRFCFALALIMGGALGNVLDRMLYGHVVDFLLFYWRSWYYPAFNFADIGITCGAVLAVVDEVLRSRQRRAPDS